MMETNRREFLKTMAMVGAGVGISSQAVSNVLPKISERKGRSMVGFRAEPIEKIRVGLIGVGRRGPKAVPRLPRIPDVEIRAISDLFEDRVAKQIKVLKDMGQPAPTPYFGSENEWRKLCESKEIDLVYICTPWLWHAPMAVYAMQCGKHVAIEVPAAVTIEECWQLVDTAEQTQRHCMILENCCYGEYEMFALNLCRSGVLGELVHGEAAYIHDIRKNKMLEESENGNQGKWRLEWSKKHTGNPYPTHGLGPVCQYMDINYGDRFDYLTSISSNQVGLSLAAAEKYGKDSPQAKEKYLLGDMNISVIKTYKGRTIMVQHDTTSPRPYSRLNTISGTHGILCDFPLRVALEPASHKWLDDKQLEKLKSEYEHQAWKKHKDMATKIGGHGGMDFIMDYRLCHCLKLGLPLDISVYDTALWSSLVELSERSTLNKGMPVEVPDFTRGAWKNSKPMATEW